jgi:hypothetical protein
MMKLTARQLKFLSIGDRNGYNVVYPVFGAPVLKNHELRPLLDHKLVEFSDTLQTWFTTKKGSLAVSSEREMS